MYLGKLYDKFDARYTSYSKRVTNLLSRRTSLETWQFNYMTEVLISDVWQSWCHFSRELFFSSCRGCVARNGQKIKSIGVDQTWKRLGYIAKQASLNQKVTPNGHNSFAIRKEPTWGDLDIFIRIVNNIQPSNYQNLLNSYGSFTNLKHLQQVRNSCAHKNVETMGEVRQLSPNYGFSSIKSPTDLAWKTSTPHGVYGIELWLFEMNSIADFATSQS